MTKGDLEDVILAIEKRQKQNSTYLNDSEIKSAKAGEDKPEGQEGPENKEEGEEAAEKAEGEQPEGPAD